MIALSGPSVSCHYVYGGEVAIVSSEEALQALSGREEMLCMRSLSKPRAASVPLAAAGDKLDPHRGKAVCLEVHCNGESIFFCESLP